MTNTQPSAEQAERAKFQEWFEANSMPGESDWFQLDADGDYEFDPTYHSWMGWMARAAQAPQVQEIDTITFARSAWNAFAYWVERDDGNDNITEGLREAWDALEAIAPPALREAPASQPPAVQGVPAGWKLAPIEPWDEMCEAAWESEGASYVGEHKVIHSASIAYRAMLDIVPQPPVVVQGVPADVISDIQKAGSILAASWRETNSALGYKLLQHVLWFETLNRLRDAAAPQPGEQNA